MFGIGSGTKTLREAATDTLEGLLTTRGGRKLLDAFKREGEQEDVALAERQALVDELARLEERRRTGLPGLLRQETIANGRFSAAREEVKRTRLTMRRARSSVLLERAQIRYGRERAEFMLRKTADRRVLDLFDQLEALSARRVEFASRLMTTGTEDRSVEPDPSDPQFAWMTRYDKTYRMSATGSNAAKVEQLINEIEVLRLEVLKLCLSIVPGEDFAEVFARVQELIERLEIQPELEWTEPVAPKPLTPEEVARNVNGR